MDKKLHHIKLGAREDKLNNNREKWSDVNSIPCLRNNIVSKLVLNNTLVKNKRASFRVMERKLCSPKN